MRKFIVLSLGVLMAIGILIVPQKKAAAVILQPPGGAAGNVSNCPQKGFAANFSFDTTTLIRGQDNTINFTVQNLSGPGGWFNSVAFGTPKGLNIAIVEPAEGVGGPNIATGPWLILHVQGDDSGGAFPGYDGVVWTTLSDVTASGFAPIKPCTEETFNVKINVPKSVPLGNMNVAVLGAQINIKDPANASQGADAIQVFQVVDAASTTLTSLPKTGVDMATWGAATIALLSLPIVLRRRKK